MIRVHHLNESRSQRILWLLEELEVPYEIVRYQRNEKTRLAPPELKAVHPLGKSPVIEDGAVKIAESGAIVEYLLAQYGKGRLSVAPGAANWPAYIEWLHYAEGSAMLPLLLKMYTMRLGEAAARSSRASRASSRTTSPTSPGPWASGPFCSATSSPAPTSR